MSLPQVGHFALYRLTEEDARAINAVSGAPKTPDNPLGIVKYGPDNPRPYGWAVTAGQSYPFLCTAVDAAERFVTGLVLHSWSKNNPYLVHGVSLGRDRGEVSKRR